MITYALSAPWSFADLVTESAAAALRQSKFRCFEVSFSKYVLHRLVPGIEQFRIPGI